MCKLFKGSYLFFSVYSGIWLNGNSHLLMFKNLQFVYGSKLDIFNTSERIFGSLVVKVLGFWWEDYKFKS